jgi:hypothetical protein
MINVIEGNLTTLVLAIAFQIAVSFMIIVPQLFGDTPQVDHDPSPENGTQGFDTIHLPTVGLHYIWIFRLSSKNRYGIT